jgi:hypothetical protein
MNNQTHSPTSQINKRQIGILFVLFSTLILGLMAASQVLREQPNLTHTNTLSAASTTTASLTVYRTEAPPTPVRTTEAPRTRDWTLEATLDAMVKTNVALGTPSSTRRPRTRFVMPSPTFTHTASNQQTLVYHQTLTSSIFQTRDSANLTAVHSMILPPDGTLVRGVITPTPSVTPTRPN